MSSAEARRRCPEVVFLTPDHRTYRDWSRRVWTLVSSLAPVVEQVGIDEGYLVLPEGDPGEQAALIQLAVRERLRLSCSLGVATCKVVAKIGSDARKPGGITVVPAGGEAAFLAPLPVRALPGVGPKAQSRLTDAGVTTIGRLAELDDGRLARAPARPGGRGAAPARPRDRPAAGGRRARRGDLALERGDVRPRHRRPRGAARVSAGDGGVAGGLAGAAGDDRAHGDRQAALPRLRDRHQVTELRGRHRRRRDHREPGLRAARPGAAPAARADPARGRRRGRLRPAQAARAAAEPRIRRRRGCALRGAGATGSTRGRAAACAGTACPCAWWRGTAAPCPRRPARAPP